MNKVKATIENGLKCVYINDNLSRRFDTRGNDLAYTKANEYVSKMMNAKTYTVLQEPEEAEFYRLTMGLSHWHEVVTFAKGNKSIHKESVLDIQSGIQLLRDNFIAIPF